MKFDLTLLSYNLDHVIADTQAAEALGFDGLWVAETKGDPFLGLTLAAEHSQRLSLGTAIAVAFPRSPTTLAYIAWDLARYTHGRFILGLGTQVKAHNVLRFGVKWEKPVKKLRETIEAIRACWDCWQNDRPLDYVGEFFKLQLMTPFFNPGPHAYPHVPIYISAVNEQMLRLAGSACDGVHIHPVHTVKYLQEFALPHIEAGLARNGRSRADIALTSGIFAIPTDGTTPASEYEAFVRQQLSFYMSTPAYKVVLELHGWSELARQLSYLARGGEWHKMPALIGDDVLDACAVTGTWAELPAKVHARYNGLLDRVSYYLPFTPGADDIGWQATLNGFRTLATTRLDHS
ncbi:MAG: TIGR03617 family F420-dependent LLM class oxidoreductase [Anaerolineales bacterium]|nr:TIGR03617 family F420-dependent LLM class oxidoreductase [Anaerolineales bacterium]